MTQACGERSRTINADFLLFFSVYLCVTSFDVAQDRSAYLRVTVLVKAR
jgi:hypothetical protein